MTLRITGKNPLPTVSGAALEKASTDLIILNAKSTIRIECHPRSCEKLHRLLRTVQIACGRSGRIIHIFKVRGAPFFDGFSFQFLDSLDLVDLGGELLWAWQHCCFLLTIDWSRYGFTSMALLHLFDPLLRLYAVNRCTPTSIFTLPCSLFNFSHRYASSPLSIRYLLLTSNSLE